MKKLYTLLFTILTIVSIGQVTNLIGKTKPQIREYWQTKISSNHMSDKPNYWYDNVFTISSNILYFEAIFDETGKCYQHTQAITFDEASIYTARLKQLGYTYKKSEDIFISPNRKHSCKIENAMQLTSNVNANHFLVFELISNGHRRIVDRSMDRKELIIINKFLLDSLRQYKVELTYKKFEFGGYQFDDLVPIYTLTNKEGDVIIIKNETSFDGSIEGFTGYYQISMSNGWWENSLSLKDALRSVLEHINHKEN